ncbi:MAG: group II intron maturase-specific domain-containing protein [Wolbachia sp.]
MEKPGFDFLLVSIRQYPVKRNKRPYKLLIKPSRESIKQHTKIIKHKLKKMLAALQEAVIKELNPIIRGWCQYYTLAVSSKIFNSLDDIMFKKFWKWAIFRHQNKGRFWIKKKYFKKYNNDNWRFMSSNGTYLIKHKDHAIKRHVKVLGTKSPYDGDWIYLGSRLKKIPDKSPRVTKLLKIQQSKCNHCRLYFRFDYVIEVHHRDKNRNNNNIKNLSLFHGHCHDNLHRSMNDKHQIREKPDDGKLSSSVSKSIGEGLLSLLR